MFNKFRNQCSMKKASLGKGIMKGKTLLMGLMVSAMTFSASAADLTTYDAVSKTVTWDTSTMIAEIMKAFTAGLSLLLVFLPIGLGVGLIVYYAKKGVKTS